LNHKSVCFTLPLLNKDRVQFELNAIDFLSLPASESKDVIVERIASAARSDSVRRPIGFRPPPDQIASAVRSDCVRRPMIIYQEVWA
jgi:hypothetical protein